MLDYLFLTEEEVRQLTWHYPSFTTIILFILSIVFFLFLNAFFVANEFASARVRLSQLRETDEDSKKEANKRAKARNIVHNLDTFLSANQVGITLASLALGALGEPFIASLLSPILSFCLHLRPEVVSIISYILAYGLFTFAHVVLGELVPKSLAIRHPLAVAMSTSVWMTRFAKWTGPIIRLFNNTANWIAHKVFGVDPHYTPETHHSAEEISHILEESERSHEVTETEAEISQNALELNDRAVRDIIVPRNDVEFLDINDSFELNLEKVSTSRHSRFTIADGHLDNVKGWIHVKDMLQLIRKGSKDIMSVRRTLKVVPETMKLDTLLDFFSKERTHCALVVDEHGCVIGQVYLDDVLEEIVGNDIQDEFEAEEARDFFPVGPDQYIASGAMALFDLEEALPALGEIESDSGVSTIGGHITDCLGHMPELNESIRIRDYVITVTGTDGRRVTQTRIELRPIEPTPTDD